MDGPFPFRMLLSSAAYNSHTNASNSSSAPAPPPSIALSNTISVGLVIVVSLSATLLLVAAIICIIYLPCKIARRQQNKESENQIYPASSDSLPMRSNQGESKVEGEYSQKPNHKNKQAHLEKAEDKSKGRRLIPTGFTTLHNKFLESLQQNSSYSIQKFSLKEIKQATDNFSKCIGMGSFGPVFKGSFYQGKQIECAVKIQANNSIKSDTEFLNEVALLGRLNHRYLVNLIGYCSDKSDRILVYEYMHNGSLEENLHSAEKSPLTWNQRIQIVIQVAIGIRFLHDDTDPSIIHRDIKPANILLDKKMNAKIADFGLSSSEFQFLQQSDSIKGTVGYVDPMYLQTHAFTKSSDVYSFGIMLFELLSGKSPHNGLHGIILSLVKEKDKSNATWTQFADPRLNGRFPLPELRDIADVAFSCIQKHPSSRPSMKEVVNKLCSIHDYHGSMSATSSPMHSMAGTPSHPLKLHPNHRGAQLKNVPESGDFSIHKFGMHDDTISDVESRVSSMSENCIGGAERSSNFWSQAPWPEPIKHGSRRQKDCEMGSNLPLYKENRNEMLESIASSS